MKTYYLTDQGQVRANNEDAGGVYYNRSSQLLAIVADGMGGHNAGEVASQIAVETVASKWRDTSEIIEPDIATEWLQEVLEESNEHIFNRSKAEEGLKGMGTTMVLAICTTDFLVVGHVGDSRAYLFSDKQLEQITEDHSLVNELLRTGQITEGDAAIHPRKNILSRAVGTAATVVPDVEVFSWKRQDALLLCSDGLTDKINDADIQRLFFESQDDESLSKELVHTANERGGEDNITLVIVRYNQVDESGDALC